MGSCRLPLFILFTVVGCGGGGGPTGATGGGGGFDFTGWGGGSGGGGGEGPGCRKAPVASGTVHTSVTDIAVRSNAVVTMSMKHKLDIDPVEDGCVTTFDFDIRLHPQGCDLNARFTTSDDHMAHLSALWFKADSFCENFLDPVEGSYSTYSYGNREQSEVAIWVGGLPSDVPGDQQPSACMKSVALTFPDADIRLIRSGDTVDQAMVMNLKGLVIKGDLESEGDTSERCPAKVDCPAPSHNGGTFTCYEGTNCATGYTFANGACSK